MANKNDIEGDVGQIVAGDSVVGPTLNNVMHLNIGEKEEKYLTKMQRTEINKKVKELEAISGINWRVLYRELLNKFGAEVMDVFPRSKFNDACDHIDVRLSEYVDANVKKDKTETSEPTPAPMPARAPSHAHAAQIQVKEIPCRTCQENTQSLKKVHFKILVLFVLMVLMIITEGAFLIFLSPDKASQEKLIMDRPADENCHFDGKVQSIGSTVRMADGIVRRCMDASGDAPSYWDLPIKSKY
ncbi:hypothetical protein [Undibacterium sp.]|uniref:hypothetical protein n=1 Tax=Undibacterium sp. TaxID=1914977 RepID=UPI002731851A|nr:hypothetical protein [Undibacterium sp.]MDP1976269.1 hypothetical protein [Undibacterium sp.]